MNLTDDMAKVIQNCAAGHHEVERRLSSLEQKINGNGHSGLVSDVAVMRSQIDSIHFNLGSLSAKMERMSQVLYTSIGALGVLQLVLKFLIK